MATYRAEYYKFNQAGNVWDLYYFRTSADLIVETTNKKVLTLDERTKISDFLTTFNDKNKLVQADGGGKILVDLVPDLSDIYLTKSGPTFTGTLSGNAGDFNYINAYNSTNNKLIIGSRTQEQSSTYITPWIRVIELLIVVSFKSKFFFTNSTTYLKIHESIFKCRQCY